MGFWTKPKGKSEVEINLSEIGNKLDMLSLDSKDGLWAIVDALKELTGVIKGDVAAGFEEILQAKEDELQSVRLALAAKEEEERRIVRKFREIVEENKPKERSVPFAEDKRTAEKESDFTPPTVEEVAEYCRSINSDIDAKEFVDEMTARNWTGARGTKIKSWKAAVNAKNGHAKKEDGESLPEIPSIEDVKAFARKTNSRLDPQYFIDYYNERGWKSGNGKPIKDWRAAFGALSGAMRNKELSRKNKPYSYDEALQYFKELGRPDLANDFWGYYAARNWKRNSGKDVKDWRMTARRWVINDERWEAERQEEERKAREDAE